MNTETRKKARKADESDEHVIGKLEMLKNKLASKGLTPKERLAIRVQLHKLKQAELAPE